MSGWRFYLDDVEVEEPIGWDGVEFTAKRLDNHGIDQPFSSSIQFYGKGASILQTAFMTNFVSSNVIIKIESSQKVNGIPYVYEGFIDFTTYEEINTCDTDSWSVSVGILQDEFRDKFKARYDVEIDLFGTKDLDNNTIPYGGFTSRLMRLHGQRLNLTANGGNLTDTSRTIEKITAAWNRPDFIAVMPIYWRTSDFQDIFGTTKDVVGLTYSDTNVIFTDNSNQGVSRNLRLSWEAFLIQFKFTFTNDFDIPQSTQSMSLVLTINVFNSDGSDYALHYVAGSPLSFYEDLFYIDWNEIAGSFFFTVPADGRVAFYLQWSSVGTIQVGVTGQGDSTKSYKANVIIPDGISISLLETNIADASQCYCIPVENFLRRIIYQLTGSDDKLLSNCFDEATDGVYANNVITTGLLLRRYIPPEGQNVQVRTSFKKAFESLTAIFNLGWAFEKQLDGTYKIRIEPFEYFYDNTIELSLQNPDKLTQVPVSDNYFSQLKLGFNDNWKNMALGGIDAISTDRNYFIDNKAIKYGETSTLERKSDIIAEGIAIEYSRRLQFYDINSGSSDRPNDYELFIIWTIREDTSVNLSAKSQYRLQGEGTGTITLPKYNASWSSDLSNGPLSRWGDNLRRYNLFHTSTRVALRNWSYLGMNVFGLLQPEWRFQVGEYITRFDSAVNELIQPNVIENTSTTPSFTIRLAEDTIISANIIRPDFKEYLLKPIIFEFEYPQAFCDFIQMANYTPYRKIKVTMGSLSIQGWILEIKNKPEDNSGGTTIFRLVAAKFQESDEQRAYSDGYSDGYE
jgi:hypothetical protein